MKTVLILITNVSFVITFVVMFTTGLLDIELPWNYFSTMPWFRRC